MELVLIGNAAEIANAFLRERAQANLKSIHYIAKENGNDVGLLSIDLFPNVDYLVLYELCVPKAIRRQGLGSKLLAEAEKLAKFFERDLIVLNPSPFETDYPRKRLVDWYKKHGYKNRRSSSGELEKRLVGYGVDSLPS